MTPHARRQLAARIKSKPKTRASPPQVETKSARVCASKHRHPDEITARAAAAMHIEQIANVDTLYVYRCPECNGWHLTKHPNGVPVRAGDPVAEESAHGQLLGLIMSGKVSSYFDCAHGERPDQIWIHSACLTLEAQGKIRRHKEHAHQIVWAPNKEFA